MSDHSIAPSRLLLRLESEIASARTQLDADCKRAERAAYLARVGRLEEAKQQIRELKKWYEKRQNIELSIWTNLAEGLIAYFDNVGVSTTDRVQRAYALSAAAGLGALRALCAAWLAQWDYSRLDMESLSSHVSEALATSEPQNHAARARACLVAAQALHFAARPDLAKLWYGRSRFHASADGDDVTISALMHNMAWLQMLTMRQIVLCGGQTNLKGAGHALATAQATEDFDRMKGDASWVDLKPILRAQIASLRGDYEQAMLLYQMHGETALAPSRLQANLLADKAWCHVSVGQEDKAIDCSELALRSLNEETHIDDRAATHSRLRQVFAAVNDSARRDQQERLAESAWSAHLGMQSRIVQLLAGMDERGSLASVQ